jgi:hypothetical protein
MFMVLALNAATPRVAMLPNIRRDMDHGVMWCVSKTLFAVYVPAASYPNQTAIRRPHTPQSYWIRRVQQVSRHNLAAALAVGSRLNPLSTPAQRSRRAMCANSQRKKEP